MILFAIKREPAMARYITAFVFENSSIENGWCESRFNLNANKLWAPGNRTVVAA